MLDTIIKKLAPEVAKNCKGYLGYRNVDVYVGFEPPVTVYEDRITLFWFINIEYPIVIPKIGQIIRINEPDGSRYCTGSVIAVEESNPEGDTLFLKYFRRYRITMKPIQTIGA